MEEGRLKRNYIPHIALCIVGFISIILTCKHSIPHDPAWLTTTRYWDKDELRYVEEVIYSVPYKVLYVNFIERLPYTVSSIVTSIFIITLSFTEIINVDKNIGISH